MNNQLPAQANSIDLMCVRFAMSAVLELGAKFNLRRDINNLVTLSGKFWVWPQSSLEKLRNSSINVATNSKRGKGSRN